MRSANIPYHPALPAITPAMSQGNVENQAYEQIVSDHVPFLTTVSVGNDLHVRLISWNVLQDDSFNGFAPLGRNRCGESDSQRRKRHDRIAESLGKFKNANDAPEFIALQEIDAKEGSELYLKIKSALGDDYQFFEVDNQIVSHHGCLILYNSRKITPISISECDLSSLSGCYGKFRLKDHGNRTVKIGSVHPPFLHDPTHHETEIKNFLNDEFVDVSIVAGDYNCAVVADPRNSNPLNITTSACVNTFREGELQGACSIDACFYKGGEESDAYRQSVTQHLNPITGRPYEANELKPIELIGDSDAIAIALQQKEIQELRPCIAVDEYFSEAKLINGRQTIPEYQKELRRTYKDDEISVHPASTVNNERGIAIKVPRVVYNHFLVLENSCFQVTLKEGQVMPELYVCALSNNISKLTLMMKFAAVTDQAAFVEFWNQLNAFKQALDSVEGMENVHTDVKESFKSLYATLLSDQLTDSIETRTIVAKHFATEMVGLLRPQQRNVASEGEVLLNKPDQKKLTASMRRLDRKLYGKPPMSKVLKTVILGVIGAIVGFAIGLVVGSLIAHAPGGFAGACLGALKGWTVGTAAAVGTGAALGAAGSAAGFFSAKRNADRYNCKQNSVSEELKQRLLTLTQSN